MKVPFVAAGNFCFFFCGAGGWGSSGLKPLLYIYQKLSKNTCTNTRTLTLSILLRGIETIEID